MTLGAPHLLELISPHADQLGSRCQLHARDGTTEFDSDFAFKAKKRDGTTEFDPDFAFKKAKRDGTTEFDPDFAFKE